MYNLCFYFFMFLIFSILGWITECIYCSISERKIVINRGYLIGPYCPIYGIGVIYGYTFLTLFESNPILLFVMAMIGASILEYITSYTMEKLFNARWWDYSDKPVNINGRICLRNAIMFGLIGIIFTYSAKPLFVDLVDMIPDNTLILFNLILMFFFTIDNIVSFNIMNKIKNNFTSIKKDSTDEIEKEVNKLLLSHRFYFKKLFKSFPNVNFTLPSSDEIKKSINKVLHKNVKKKAK